MGYATRAKRTAAWVYPLAAAVGVVCLAALGGAGLAQQVAGHATIARAPVVAVVDMSRLLRRSSEWQDLTEQRMRLLDTRQRTLNKLTRRVQMLSNDYENLPPGTEERQNKAAEIEQALGELQRTGREFDARVAKQQNDAARTMFGKLNAVTSTYAREHDIDLVLKKHGLPPAGPETLEQSLLLATSEVLYANPDLDISDAVVEKLNAEYSGPIQVK